MHKQKTDFETMLDMITKTDIEIETIIDEKLDKRIETFDIRLEFDNDGKLLDIYHVV